MIERKSGGENAHPAWFPCTPGLQNLISSTTLTWKPTPWTSESTLFTAAMLFLSTLASVLGGRMVGGSRKVRIGSFSTNVTLHSTSFGEPGSSCSIFDALARISLTSASLSDGTLL